MIVGDERDWLDEDVSLNRLTTAYVHRRHTGIFVCEHVI